MESYNDNRPNLLQGPRQKGPRSHNLLSLAAVPMDPGRLASSKLRLIDSLNHLSISLMYHHPPLQLP